MRRAALLTGAAALLFGCAGDPFTFAPLPELTPDGGAPRVVDSSPATDAAPTGCYLDASCVDVRDAAPLIDAGAADVLAASDVLEAAADVAARDAGPELDAPDDAPLEAAPREAGPPPAVCCLGGAMVACSAGVGFSCYPAGSSCSASCQALGDGGQWCAASCTGTPSACAPSACTVGAQCLYTAGGGQTFPGTIGPCD